MKWMIQNSHLENKKAKNVCNLKMMNFNKLQDFYIKDKLLKTWEKMKAFQAFIKILTLMAYSKQREKSIQTFQNKIYNYEFMYGLVLFNISMISLSYIEKTSF